MNERINYIPGILIELLAIKPISKPCIHKYWCCFEIGLTISPLGIVDVVDYILPNGDIAMKPQTSL